MQILWKNYVFIKLEERNWKTQMKKGSTFNLLTDVKTPFFAKAIYVTNLFKCETLF